MIECYIVICIVISCWWVISDYFKRCLCTWRIIPVSKWLITMAIAGPLRTEGCSPSKCPFLHGVSLGWSSKYREGPKQSIPATPWKINGWNLQISHLERKMIWTKPLWGHVPAVNLPGCTSIDPTDHLQVRQSSFGGPDFFFWPAFVWRPYSRRMFFLCIPNVEHELFKPPFFQGLC